MPRDMAYGSTPLLANPDLGATMEVEASLRKEGEAYTLTFEDLVWEGSEDDLRRLIFFWYREIPEGVTAYVS